MPPEERRQLAGLATERQFRSEVRRTLAIIGSLVVLALLGVAILLAEHASAAQPVFLIGR